MEVILGTSDDLDGVPVPLQKAFRSHKLIQEEMSIYQTKKDVVIISHHHDTFGILGEHKVQ